MKDSKLTSLTNFSRRAPPPARLQSLPPQTSTLSTKSGIVRKFDGLETKADTVHDRKRNSFIMGVEEMWIGVRTTTRMSMRRMQDSQSRVVAVSLESENRIRHGTDYAAFCRQLTTTMPSEQFTLSSCHPLRQVQGREHNLTTTQPQNVDCSFKGMTARDGAMLTSDSDIEIEDVWTIGMWLTPTARHQQLQPILVLQNPHAPEICNGIWLMIAQYRDNFLFYFVANNDMQSCRVVPLINTLQVQERTLLSVAVGNHSTALYVNDATVLTMPHVPLQSESALTLQLFGQHGTTSPSIPFDGAIEQVTFYDAVLTLEQVQDVWGTPVVSPTLPMMELDAVEPNPVAIAQDTVNGTSILLQGMQVSQPWLPLAVELLSLPEQGVLEWQETSIENSTRLLLPVNETSLTLEYHMSTNDYFTTPTEDIHGNMLDGLPIEGFEYRFVALDRDNEEKIVGESEPMYQAVDIHQVNTPSTWPIIPPPVFLGLEKKKKPQFDFGDTIRLANRQDREVNWVRISMTTVNGTMTLDPENLGLAYFPSWCQSPRSPWHCTGDGNDDRMTTFLASPGDVQAIFDGVQYRALVPGSPDLITLDVFDGVGSDCLEAYEQFQNETIQRECFHSQTTIAIPKVEIPNPYDNDENNIFGIPNTDFRKFGWADAAFWVVVGLLLVLLCCLGCQCLPNCMARGAGVTPDDYDTDEDDLEAGHRCPHCKQCAEKCNEQVDDTKESETECKLVEEETSG